MSAFELPRDDLTYRCNASMCPRTGTRASEKGAWIATSETGQTISALVSADERADLALGACYNDTGVEVAAA